MFESRRREEGIGERVESLRWLRGRRFDGGGVDAAGEWTKKRRERSRRREREREEERASRWRRFDCVFEWTGATRSKLDWMEGC